jgi:hypothetical protein
LIFGKEHGLAVFQIALTFFKRGFSDSADYFSVSETMPGLSDMNYKSLLSLLKGLWRPQMAQQQVGNPPVELVNNLLTCT